MWSTMLSMGQEFQEEQGLDIPAVEKETSGISSFSSPVLSLLETWKGRLDASVRDKALAVAIAGFVFMVIGFAIRQGASSKQSGVHNVVCCWKKLGTVEQKLISTARTEAKTVDSDAHLALAQVSRVRGEFDKFLDSLQGRGFLFNAPHLRGM